MVPRRNSGVVLPGVSQRDASSYWCFWGRRVCGRVQAGSGGVFLLENKGEGKGCGEVGGWGGDTQRNRQVNAHAFVKNTLQCSPGVRGNVIL